ncbi:MAG: hypothetical protein R2705_08125 [Ilumatobacteraceae bacterium]
MTGLLGPNGAGKTTLSAITGMCAVNQGQLTVNGVAPRSDREVYRTLALVPEDKRSRRDSPPGGSSSTSPPSTKSPTGTRRPRRWPPWDSPMPPTGGSTGSRRGCASEPRSPPRWSAIRVIVLDEPLNGADPVQRLHLIELFKRLGADGRTVIVSSHVLQEVERLAERVLVIVHGRLAAAGTRAAIRDAMNDRPARSSSGRATVGRWPPNSCRSDR